MQLENLITSIEGAKGILLGRIESLGEDFYQKTGVRSPDGRLSLYAMGCSSPKPDIQEVFVGVQPEDPAYTRGVENIFSRMTGLVKVEGKPIYKQGDNVSVRFGEDGSITIQYGQRGQVTNKGYCGRIEQVVQSLIKAITPRNKQGTRVIERPDISLEQTRKLEGSSIPYKSMEDIDPHDINGEAYGIRISKYVGKITMEGPQDGQKRVLLRLDLGGRSRKDMAVCFKQLRDEGYHAQLDDRVLWVEQRFKSMPKKEQLMDFLNKISINLDIWG